jgi:PKD repeat protein
LLKLIYRFSIFAILRLINILELIMKKSTFLAGIMLIPAFIFAQNQRQPGMHLPVPTEKGKGIIDTRIDNMGYWKKMAEQGYVEVAPVIRLENSVFTGSRINSPMVMTTNSPDVPVTSVNSTQSENSIFVEPENELSVLNSNNSTQNPVGSLYGADYLISGDGGETWGGSVNGAGGSNSGDPTTAISLTGRRYVGFIDNNWGQSIAYSADGGNTWVSVVCGAPTADLLDKNHMWIDNSPASSYEGYVYSAWTDFGDASSPIKITRSADDGLTYSSPINVSQAVNAGSHCQGVNIQTGPNGEVYVIWTIYDSWPSDETAIGLAKSTNGGTSYAPATRIISNIRGIRTSETSKNQRVNSFPSMAVDISNSPRSGNIYIVWTNIGVPGINTGPDIDVYMIRSTNGGSTWSTPIKVNQDPSGLGKEHYFPWITCDPVTGDLSVIFYDDRNVTSTQCEVYCANSFDGGNTWEDFKVSDVAFTPAPITGLAGGYMGDYLGISARGSKVYPLWSDNRTGTVMSYCSPYDLSPYPDANFTADNVTPCLNDTVVLTDMTNKNPLTWAWTITPLTFSYVNGTSASSQHPHVRFEAYGSYNVQLIVSNAVGYDTLIRNNYINVNYANADFSANNTKPVINNPIVFTDLSSCTISSWSWNFGSDAIPATANTQGPHTVTYSSAGFKTVSLTVNGNVTNTKTNYIEALPETFNMSNNSITTCSGIFYDPQGTGNYLNNLDYTMTFYPGDTSKSIRMIFTLFDLEYQASCGYDYLKIYDGPTSSSNLLGTYCGTNSPDTVASSDPSGALTFKFHSDMSVVGQGWQANISCVTPPPPPPPAYCTGNATTCDEYISRVQIGNIDNSSNCTSGGYYNYTSLSTKVSPGISYLITVTNGNLNWSSDQCGIWVDWNHDYDFGDAGETITVSGTPGIGPYTANIVPPANAVKGMTRLRIRITYTGEVNPCGTVTWGEVEDYHLYVGTPGLWNGGTAGSQTDWNTANNWDDGRVPGSTTSVVIPAGSAYYPVVSGSYSCGDLNIRDNGSMTIQPGAIMQVNGNLNIGQGASGILIINAATCNVTGIVNVSSGGTVTITNGGILNEN